MKTIVFLSQLDINLIKFRLPIMTDLIQKNYHVVALIPKGKYTDELTKHGVHVIYYYLDRKSFNLFKECRTCVELFIKLKKINPDILHTFTIKPNIYGGTLGKLSGIKKIVTSVTGLGGYFSERSILSRIVQFIILFLYKVLSYFTTIILFQNTDDQDFFISKRIISRNRTSLIKGSGIDTNCWKINRENQKLNGTIKFVLVARLLQQKGIIEFCEAAKELRKRYSNKVEFYLSGDEDPGNRYNVSKDDLTSYIQKKDVVFLGWQEKVKEQLAEMDVFTLPSYYREGIPRTGIEAASMSMPIITTNSVGCKELVDDNVNGILIQPKSVSGLVAAMVSFVENPNLIKEMGYESRKKAVNEFDVKHVINAHSEIYEQ